MITVLLTRKPSISAVFTAVLITAAMVTAIGVGTMVQSATAQVVFDSGFEYSGGEPTVGTDAANLNGADGQIGTFSGTLPIGDGSNPGIELMGFDDHGGPNPNNSRILFVDRAVADGSFFANLASTIPVDNANVSFELGTRRSSGTKGRQHVKDYDIIGWDGSGNESFHLRISANSEDDDPVDTVGARMRVGNVSDAGGTVTWDLPTVVGADADFDMENTGGSFNRGHIATFNLSLGDTGYVLDWENFSTRMDPNAYTTAELPYNGPATELAKIEITFQGAFEANGVDQTDDNSFRSGYALDNLRVALVPEPHSVALALMATAGMFLRRRRRIV